MVESKLVELVVAGSSPVGHPILNFFTHLSHQRFHPRNLYRSGRSQTLSAHAGHSVRYERQIH